MLIQLFVGLFLLLFSFQILLHFLICKKKIAFVFLWSLIIPIFSGEETRVIPRILGLRAQWRKNEKEWKRLEEAGISEKVLNDAISSFIMHVSFLRLL